MKELNRMKRKAMKIYHFQFNKTRGQPMLMHGKQHKNQSWGVGLNGQIQSNLNPFAVANLACVVDLW